jgi:hypothetical protein
MSLPASALSPPPAPIASKRTFLFQRQTAPSSALSRCEPHRHRALPLASRRLPPRARLAPFETLRCAGKNRISTRPLLPSRNVESLHSYASARTSQQPLSAHILSLPCAPSGKANYCLPRDRMRNSKSSPPFDCISLGSDPTHFPLNRK